MRGAQEHAGLGRGEPRALSSRLDEHALDLNGINWARRAGLGAEGSTRTRSRPRGAELLERLPDELVHRPELRLRPGRARLEWREVEQVADQALEPSGLDPHGLEQGSRDRPARARERRTREPVDGDAGIAVSGERKSWLTARSTAVLTVSLRRSASASSASPARRSRSEATARSDAGAGGSGGGRRGSGRGCSAGRVERSNEAGPPASSSRGDSPGGGSCRGPRSIRALSTPSTPATCVGDRGEFVRQKLRPREERGVEICARRAVSRSRCSASAVRRRARAAKSLTTIAVTRYTASANQFVRSASVNVCTGGRKKKLKASMLAIETGIAYARSPHDRDRYNREDVERAQAENRHPFLDDRDHGGDDRHRADTGCDAPERRSNALHSQHTVIIPAMLPLVDDGATARAAARDTPRAV